MYGKVTIKIKFLNYEIVRVQPYTCPNCNREMVVRNLNRIECEYCNNKYREQMKIILDAQENNKCPRCGEQIQYPDDGYWNCSCGTIKTFRYWDAGEDPDERYGDSFSDAGLYSGIVKPSSPHSPLMPNICGKIADKIIPAHKFKKYPEGYVFCDDYCKFIAFDLSPDNLYKIGGKKVVEYKVRGETRKYTAYVLHPLTIVDIEQKFRETYSLLDFEFIY